MADMLLISGAIHAGTSKGGRKIIGVVIGFFAMILIVIICVAASLISIFSNSGKINSGFNAKDTAIYKELRIIYDEYCAEQLETMEEMEEKCREEHMYTMMVDVYNPDTDKTEKVEQKYCYAEIICDYNYISSAYTMAYLSVKNQKDYLSDKAKVKINKDEVTAFWNIVAGIETEQGITDSKKPTFLIHNPVMTAEEIAEYFFVSEILQKQFLQSVFLISQYIGAETFGEVISVSANQLGIPLYYQYDQAWGNISYGNGTIAKNGCAPTCIAMVFTYLKGYTITPTDIVGYTKNNYYVNGQGSSWQIFEACANQWGIRCSSIGTSKTAITKALEEGKPVILSMGPGTFTQSGHFIVLTGITESGKVTVNDPNDNSSKKHAEKEFSISQVLSEAKGGWMFE